MSRVDPQIKAMVLAEIGAGSTLKTLSDKYQLSQVTIRHWAKDNGIIKGHLQPVLQQNANEMLIAEIKAKGLDKKIISKVDALLEATQALMIPSGASGERPDFTAIKNGIDIILKILGGYAPTKAINENINRDVGPDMSIYNDEEIATMAAIYEQATKRAQAKPIEVVVV